MTTSTVSGNKDRTTNTVSVFQNRMGQIYTVRMYSTYSIRLQQCMRDAVKKRKVHRKGISASMPMSGGPSEMITTESGGTCAAGTFTATAIPPHRRSSFLHELRQ